MSTSAATRLDIGGPASFAPVMATGIVSTAAALWGQALVSAVLLAVAAIAFAGLTVALALRVARTPRAVAADLADPTRAFGFFTIVAGAAVLGERLAAAGAGPVGAALLWIAIAAWLALGWAVPACVMTSASKPGLAAVDGGWLLWVVATQAASTAAAAIAAMPGAGAVGRGLVVVAVLGWAIGAVLYVVVIALVMLRLLVHPLAPAQLNATYWIAMGATAITVLAAARVLGLPATAPAVAAVAPAVRGLGLALWAFGAWWIPLLVVLTVWRHAAGRDPLRYRPDLWALVFPLGMFSAASGAFGRAAGLAFMVAIGRAEFWVALAAWAAVTAGLAAAVAGAVRGR